MLKKYDPLEDYLEEERMYSFLQKPLVHLASELMDELGYHTNGDFELALARTFDVCCSLRIHIPSHFRKVYVYDEHGLHTDWQLTEFGSYLLLVNGNSRNARVAISQLYFLRKSTD